MMKIPKITTDQNYYRFGVVIPRLSPSLGIPREYGYFLELTK